MMAFLIWCLFGLVIGALARLIMPGRQSMGIIMTIILGVIGSFVGGFLGSLFGAGKAVAFKPSGFIGSLIGALVVLFAYSYFSKPRK